MATVLRPAPAFVRNLVKPLSDAIVETGDLTLFALQVLLGSFWPPRRAGMTVVADFMGVMGGALVSIKVYHIDAHYYWSNAEGRIGMYDIVCGLIKPTFFGGAIAILSCYRGFHSEAGAEGVGRAATRAFVA